MLPELKPRLFKADEEFENETLAIDFYIEGSPCKGTLAIIHEPEAN